MKVSIDLNFEQLLATIRQLTPSERKELLEALATDEIPQTKKKPNQLQELLLQGPTWSETDYQNFLKTREQLNKVGDHDIN